MPKWFEADKDGLAKLLRKRGVEFGVLELIQNALDEDTKEVEVTLHKLPGRRQRYRLRVVDDNPEGFKDLTHAYTLFVESEKKGDPLKRGRFNLGEKLVIALCERAQISTTKGTIRFDEDGERRHLRQRQDSGSVFEGEIIMDEEEASRVDDRVRYVIPPEGITVFYNGEPLGHRTPLRSFTHNLPTVKADLDGNLTPTRRNAIIEIHQPAPGEEATIYEMGMPVVETHDCYHVNIMQKVPLNMSRDNVTPGYLREVRTAVLNHVHDIIEDEVANDTWVKSALEDDNVEGEAVTTVLTKLYGKNRVVYDPSDPESNSRAIDRGASVIHGRSFSKAAWSNIREHDSAGTPSAGVKYATPKPFHPDGRDLKRLAEEDWSEAQRRTADYAKWLARELMGIEIHVVLADDPGWKFGGAWGSRVLTVNIRDRRWPGFNEVSDAVNGFLIHEFAHHYEGSHLSEHYHKALCKLGAKLCRLALEQPEKMQSFARKES